MDEAVNYRMKLVIDPKNVVKANRELRAMERYFERIQGRVMKIGRTRMVPEIMIRDYASKQIDGVLGKLSQLKSMVLDTNLNISTTTVQTMQLSGTSGLIAAINANTLALMNSASTSGAGIEDKKESSSWLDNLKKNFKDITGADLSINSGLDMFRNWDTWRMDRAAYKDMKEKNANPSSGPSPGGPSAGSPGNPNNNPKNPGNSNLTKQLSQIRSAVYQVKNSIDRKQLICNCGPGQFTGGGRGGGKGKRGGSKGSRRGFNNPRNANPPRQRANNSDTSRNTRGMDSSRDSNPFNRNRPNRPNNRPKRTRTSRRPGQISGIMGIAQNFGGMGGMGLPDFGSFMDMDGFADRMTGSGSKLMKGLGKGAGLAKKFLGGPLGIAMDAASIATAAPGKERSEAIGSTVGGIAGGALGGAIGTAILPGIGTTVGAYVGSMAGDFVGGKIGGFVHDKLPVIKDTFKQGKDWFTEKAGKFGNAVGSFFGKKTPSGPSPGITPSNHEFSGSRGGFSQGSGGLMGLMNTDALKKGLMPLADMFGLKGLADKFSGFWQEKGPAIKENLKDKVAVRNNAPALSAATKNGQQIPQIVQISPEQMGQLSGYLQNFKKDTINNVSVNFPAGAVQMNVHENAIDIGAIVSQVAARLDAELRKAQQNRKPALP